MEEYDLSVDAPPNDVIKIVKTYGVARISNYLQNVLPLKNELISLFESLPEANDYLFGKAIRFPSDKWKENMTPKTIDFFKSSWMKEIATKYQPLKKGVNVNVFSTFDYRYDNGIAANGWAHFDQLQRFKFFLYLSDVDNECGPLCVAPGTHKMGKKLRLKNCKKHRFGRYYGDPGICKKWEKPQNHHPNIKYELCALNGSAGTLIIFDSDVIHKGGTVNKGKRRLVVRGHSW